MKSNAMEAEEAPVNELGRRRTWRRLLAFNFLAKRNLDKYLAVS